MTGRPRALGTAGSRRGGVLRRPPARIAAALLGVLPLLAACGSSTPAAAPSSSAAAAAGRPGPSTAGSSTPGSSSALTGDVTVLAAASLTGTFTALAHDFEAAHPGVHVRLSFGGSSGLAAQILAGAPADVFASASTTTMKQVTDGGAAQGEPRVFATNVLEIAVPPGNPGHVQGLRDFADPQRRLALCAPTVPCGDAAAKVFAAAGITPQPDTLEEDVKAVLTKVELGEVDAGMVYRTDVRAAGDKVQGIEVPEASADVNTYPIVVLRDAPNPTAARAFVDLVTSPRGEAVLGQAGFGQAGFGKPGS